MSWQEELRRLDGELASGKITQHQHRKQRDELLAAASGNAAPSPNAAPLARSERSGWQTSNPGLATPPPNPPGRPPKPPSAPPPPPPPPPPKPVPPPAQQQPTQPQPDQQPAKPEPAKQEPAKPRPVEKLEKAKKKPANPSEALLETDRQTTAPSPADSNPTDSMPYPKIGDAPTVVRPAVHPPAPPIPPLNMQPSVKSDPSAVPAANTQPYAAANPFPEPEPHSPRRSRPTWLFLAGGVLLVLALIIGGTWWLRSGEQTPVAQTPAPAPAPSSPAAPPTPSVEDKLPALPGTANPNNSKMSIDKGAELKIYSPQEAQLMKNNGGQELIYRNSSEGANGYMVMVVPTFNPANAGAMAKALEDFSVNAGLKPAKTGAPPHSVSGKNPNGQLAGTWYASGNMTVAVWVSQDLKGSEPALLKRLTETRDLVARSLPPS